MIRKRLASLRLRLWLLVFLAFMPALGLMVYTALEQRQHAVKEVKNQALRMAQIASSDQERRIDGTRYLLMPWHMYPTCATAMRPHAIAFWPPS